MLLCYMLLNYLCFLSYLIPTACNFVHDFQIEMISHVSECLLGLDQLLWRFLCFDKIKFLDSWLPDWRPEPPPPTLCGIKPSTYILVYALLIFGFKWFSFKQEEHLAKGVRDLKQRHISSLLAAMEKGVSKKLQEKDREIENINRKNKELIERIRQVAAEAQNWHYRAKYNESVVNVLKSNLQQAISQGADQGKEGFGDNEIDDAASYIEPNNYLNFSGDTAKPLPWNYQGLKEHVTCRACKTREVSMLLMPCRHLCLCKECDALINVCPVCRLIKTNSFQVFLS